MLNLLTNANRNNKDISGSELVDVLNQINEISIISKTDRGLSYDFARSKTCLKKKGLDKHIVFPRKNRRRYPINSERHTYSLQNIVIRNLTIRLTENLNLDREGTWGSLLCALWQFEKCRFIADSGRGSSLIFNSRGDFRFTHNTFNFPESGVIGIWLLCFGDGSRVWFQRNCFSNSSIQLRSVIDNTDTSLEKISWKNRDAYILKNDAYYQAMMKQHHQLPDGIQLEFPHRNSNRIIGLHSLSFLGNKGIDVLSLYCNSREYVFREMNEINCLNFEEHFLNAQEVRLYMGVRENIDPNFDYPNHNRRIFLKMRDAANKHQDTFLSNVLERQLDRIEYYLTKDQQVSFRQNPGQWIGYWQDRARYAWRRWSSDFYRSWLRPLILLFVGYFLLSLLPAIWISSLTFSDLVGFSLRPITRLPLYVQELEQLFPSKYVLLSESSINVLRLIGYVQITWVALCGFALGKAIKR